MEKELNGVIFYDELAEIVNELDEEEVQYLDLIENISDQIFEYMKKKDMNKSDLAQKMNVSRSYVTQILQGKNISLKTLNKLVFAMDGRFSHKISSKDENIRWFGLADNKKHSSFQKNVNYKKQGGEEHCSEFEFIEINVA